MCVYIYVRTVYLYSVPGNLVEGRAGNLVDFGSLASGYLLFPQSLQCTVIHNMYVHRGGNIDQRLMGGIYGEDKMRENVREIGRKREDIRELESKRKNVDKGGA